MKNSIRVSFLLASAMMASVSSAELYRFTMSGYATGTHSAGGTQSSFANELLSMSFVTDTATITQTNPLWINTVKLDKAQLSMTFGKFGTLGFDNIYVSPTRTSGFIDTIRIQVGKTTNTMIIALQNAANPEDGSAPFRVQAFNPFPPLRGYDLKSPRDQGVDFYGPTFLKANQGDFSFTSMTNMRFTAQPVPEPATMAVLGLGAAAMLRRRRK